MKHDFSSRSLIAAGAMALMVFMACSDDENNPAATPNTGSVAGTVTFLGTWPASGNVQVGAYSVINTPPGVPTGPPDGFTDPIAGQPGSYAYRIDGLEVGDYAAVFVSWRDPASPSTARVIGVYWAFEDSVGVRDTPPTPWPPGPMPFTIKKGLVTGGLDITADLDLITP